MLEFTAFHAFQGLGLLAVCLLLAERTRAICFTAHLDAAMLRRAIVDLLGRRDLATARVVVAAAAPAWACAGVAPLLRDDLPARERDYLADLALLDVSAGASRGMRALRIAATMASAVGFIGAALEMHWVLAGEHGLAGLRAGAVESIGLSRGVLCVSLGIATSSLAVGSWVVLRAAARARIDEAHRVRAAVAEALSR